MNKRNLELIADFYEFTMANGYFVKNMNEIAYFDIFFRKVPDNGGFAIFAGLEQVIEFIKDLHFEERRHLQERIANEPSCLGEEFLIIVSANSIY